MNGRDQDSRRKGKEEIVGMITATGTEMNPQLLRELAVHFHSEEEYAWEISIR